MRFLRTSAAFLLPAVAVAAALHWSSRPVSRGNEPGFRMPAADPRDPIDRALDLPENARLAAWLRQDHAFRPPPPRWGRFPFATWTDDFACIRSREGDLKIVERGCEPRWFRVSDRIDVALAEAIEAHFGFARDLLSFRYHEGDGSRAAVEAAIATALLERGIVVHPDRILPDYGWLVRETAPALGPLARDIVAAYWDRPEDRMGDRAAVEALASFVQNAVPYREVPELGDGRERGGIRDPLSTLRHGGDCDCKVLLLAGLIRAIRPDLELVLLHVNRDEPHACLGVGIPAAAGEGTVRFGGRDLLVIETTDDWDLGRLSVRTDLRDALASRIE